MFCPNCGNELPDNAAFCGRCGQQLAAPAQAPAQEAAQQYYPQQAAAPYAPQSAPVATLYGPPVAPVAAPSALGKLQSMDIVRLVCSAITAIGMLMPWFRISFDKVISAAVDASGARAMMDMAIPKMGNLGISVFGLGDSVGILAKVARWMSKTATMSGASESEAAIPGLENIGISSIFYHIYEFIWVVALVALIAGIALRLSDSSKVTVLCIGCLACAVTALIGIVVALVMSSSMDNALLQVMGSYASLGLGALGDNAVKGLFGFTLAPVAVILGSIGTFLTTLVGNKTV